MLLREAEKLAKDLEAVKRTQGSNAKATMTVDWTTGYHREFLDMVGNGKRQWYVTWATVLAADAPDDDDEYHDFEDTFYAAQSRLATPTLTATRIRRLMASGWPEIVLKAIVEKTLDAGITVASVKKAQGVKKTFAPALCKDWLKIPASKQTTLLSTKRYFSTPKMDGLRCLIKLHSEDRGVYSRSLKPLFNMDAHLEALEKAIDFPCIVDGEAFACEGSWNASITGAKKKGSNVPMTLYPFDMVLRSEVDSMTYAMPASERWAMLEKLIPYDDQMFSWVHHIRVHTPEDVAQQHREDVADGWEGSVLHDADAPYACSRSASWIKVKSWLSSEFTVVNVFPGTGKHFGRAGGLMVEGEVDGVEISCEVGTGFTDTEREDLWKNREKHVGRVAEIKYFEVTDSALRFPVFLRFREEE